MENKEKLLKYLYTVLLCLFAFTLPLFTILNNISIVLLIILSLYKTFSNWPQREQLNNVDFLYITYFIVMIIGLVNTDNYKFGFFVIEKSLSFLVCPIIFYNLSLSKQQLYKIFIFFTLSCVIIILANTISIFYDFVTKGELENFSYTNFDKIFGSNTTYLSLYIATILFFWIWYLNDAKKSIYTNYFILIFSTILFGFLLLLSSRIVLVTAVTSFFYLIFKYKDKKYLAVFILITLISVIQFNYNSVLRERFSTSIDFKPNVNNLNYGGAQIRLQMWYSIYVGGIKKNFLLGLGTGGGQELRKEIFYKNNLKIPYRENYNSHNQYLNNLYRNGIISLVFLLLIFANSMYDAIKRKNIIWVVFNFLIIGVCFTEVILARQNGIVFYLFFNYMFHSFHPKNHMVKSPFKKLSA